ncbi:putative protein phosphatase 2C 12 [Camellia lanceoleosa]|uniref:Uncharacterized protein n=1 Tax=Camellia lanceoleosa TaxID=1840588 RepID=A0ACC0GZK2_9ERIC|nr:putative protein phosphatase 2C 12 [Camellia lanceoleosa]
MQRRKIQNYGVICFRWQLGVDGHNGFAAAIYSKENLLNNVLAAIPSDFNSDEWVAALPRALVAGFVKTDKDFQEKGPDLIGAFLSVVLSVLVLVL